MMTISRVSTPARLAADTTNRSDAWLDRVSEESADSFPASDPPSWSPLRVGSPTHDARRDGENA
jgi:hypothetical protein